MTALWITHCGECGALLKDNEFGRCENCEQKIKEIEENLEKINYHYE